MPKFPIIDTHLHVWNPESGDIKYEWLEEVPALNKPFLLDDYNEQCGKEKKQVPVDGLIKPVGHRSITD